MDPFASIVILSRNQFAADTRACLESLLADSENDQAEIIVIDNGSDEDTLVGLREYEGRSNVKIIYNPVDMGFSGGNNTGLRAAQGDTLILLNNDTRVPPGAIRKLSYVLGENPDWGAVGPVTNAVGNEQVIWMDATHVEEILSAGKEWVDNAEGSRVLTHQLSFFCVALSRSTLNGVGELDEGFNPIYYEDVDYCLRMAQSGKRLVIAEDVFVYHRGSATMNKLPELTRRLMKRNKKRLLAKHGRSVELLPLREANLRSLESYLCERERLSVTQLDSLRYRFENRLRLGREQMPRGWFKRWAYCRRLEAVSDAWTVAEG